MSFINPFFLFAISAALLPVLYHLVRKMKAKKVPFSSLMFLKATPKEVIRKRRLRDILLMTLRAALFGLLALAFARPFIPREHLPFAAQREDQSVVLLVDNSYSMQYADRFAEARQEVLRRIDEAGPRDELAIVAFSNETQLLNALSSDHTLLREVAQRALKVSNRSTDFYKPLRLAEEILQDARHATRSVVLISDFQRNGFDGSLENWKLSPNITFVPVQIGQGEMDNAYIQAFNLDQRRAGSRVGLRFDARIAAQGGRAEQEHDVRLHIDGAQVQQQTLPARSTSPVSFQQVAPREGFYQGTLSIGDDPLRLDNQFHFSYGVAGRPSLLFVDEGGGSGAARDVFFLENAFNLGDEGLYATAASTRQRLSRSVLQNQAVVFLANVRTLDAAQLRLLREHVEAGGSLVLSFGDRADLRAFSDHLAELGIGRIDGKVDARAAQAYEAIIGEVDLRHPVFSVFASSGAGPLLRPRFRQYVKIVPDTNAVVVGKYDTGDAFLVERQLGQGKVLVYTATFNTGWTDLPIHEMYVPFVYQLARYAMSGAQQRHLFTVGEVVSWTGRPGDAWEVSAPGDRLFRVTIDDFGKGFFRETEEPGHYVAAHGQERYFFSVNVDARESDLASRDQEEAYAAIVPPPEDVATTPEQAAALALEDEEKRQKFWRYLILLALAFFALETLLANRRTSTRTQPQPTRGPAGRPGRPT